MSCQIRASKTPQSALAAHGTPQTAPLPHFQAAKLQHYICINSWWIPHEIDSNLRQSPQHNAREHDERTVWTVWTAVTSRIQLVWSYYEGGKTDNFVYKRNSLDFEINSSHTGWQDTDKILNFKLGKIVLDREATKTMYWSTWNNSECTGFRPRQYLHMIPKSNIVVSPTWS